MLFVEQIDQYMASPQCLVGKGSRRKVTMSLCFPDKETILSDLERVLIDKLKGEVRHVYVATDKDPMIGDILEYLSDKIPRLNVVHRDPWLPVSDLSALARSEWFIGNCVSSFTSFVKRERDIKGLPSSFWANSDYE